MAIVEGRFQGRLETPLSPLGRRQAELAGARLAAPSAPPRIPVPARPPVEVVHSPLSRAAATAEAAAAALGRVHGPGAVPTPRPDPGLVEIAQGAWEGLHRDEVVARFPAELEAWRLHPATAHAPGGEPLADAAAPRPARPSRAAIEALAAAAPGEGPDRTSVGGYPAGHGSDTPVDAPRRPRRDLQGGPADPARPAARALLDVPVGPDRDRPSSSSSPAGRSSAPTT